MIYANPRDNRLALEHQLLRALCNQSEVISYTAVERKGALPPEKYLISYKLKSIISIDNDQNPVFGYNHQAVITIPPEFPLGGQPICYMKTSLWHPNIKYSGHYAGRICINAQALGHWHTLDMLVLRIGQMLQYKNYHAINIQPYPEDAEVARWVREYAEPNDIVNREKRIFIDDTPLINPEDTSKPEDIRSKIKLSIKTKKPIQKRLKININLDA